MGLESGICKGIGGSQHLFNDHFLSNGIQGGLSPAVGYSYVCKQQKIIIFLSFILVMEL